MSFLQLLVLSLGLAMDATAVSLACSVYHSKAKKRQLIKAAVLFGLFQAVMPVIGYFLGLSVNDYIREIDHWIALLLLTLVGGKMVFERGDEDPQDIFSNRSLLVMAVATSIDALVVGITFSFIKINLLESIAVIGLVTFILSFVAGLFGKALSKMDSSYLKRVGGLAIIAIGINILIQHLK